MNYLAHIFLSNNNSQIQVGNFIGDFVKGKKLNHFPKQIAYGISIHRKIDEFTDSHPVVRETVAFLRPAFGRYSAIILDMYFDFMLANNFKLYSSNKSLIIFSYQFYFYTLLNYRHLPQKVKNFIFHFIFTNRLQKYKTYKGLKQSLAIMEKYKSSAIKPDLSIEFLENNLNLIETNFNLFMPDLIEFVNNEFCCQSSKN